MILGYLKSMHFIKVSTKCSLSLIRFEKFGVIICLFWFCYGLCKKTLQQQQQQWQHEESNADDTIKEIVTVKKFIESVRETGFHEKET